MESKQAYWIVIGEEPSQTPFRHTSLQSAQAEAKRLARQNRGITFTVFQAIEANTSPEDVLTVSFEDYPF